MRTSPCFGGSSGVSLEREPDGGIVRVDCERVLERFLYVMKPRKPRKPLTRARRIFRGLGYASAVLAVLAVMLFWGVNHFPWLGPALADGLRAVIGPKAVARLEDWAYAVDDRWQRLHRGDEAPRTYWQTEDVVPAPAPASVDAGGVPSFHPGDVGPMAFHAPGDGTWVAVTTRGDDARPAAFKTLVHPDVARAWAELFVVAIDLSRTDLHFVAGSTDPEATTAEGRALHRPALIPEDDRSNLVAAFNGGWKAEHGHYGVKVDGVTLLPPRDTACTVTVLDNTVRVAPWTDLHAMEDAMHFYRQTPPCLYHEGVRNPDLVDGGSWGAAVGGGAVIRRSAIGLDAKGTTLFVGVSNNTTAPALADGMNHAGAVEIAELDVNWSYPKFLVYAPNARGELDASTLFPGFVFDKDEYVRKHAPKDFFYLVRRAPRPS
jgi:hypothetical protein